MGQKGNVGLPKKRIESFCREYHIKRLGELPRGSHLLVDMLVGATPPTVSLGPS